MRLPGQNQERIGQVLPGLASLADSQVQGFRIAVAYITKAGCDLLLDVVSKKVGVSHWDSIPKAVMTSFDSGQAEARSLQPE